MVDYSDLAMPVSNDYSDLSEPSQDFKMKTVQDTLINKIVNNGKSTIPSIPQDWPSLFEHKPGFDLNKIEFPKFNPKEAQKGEELLGYVMAPEIGLPEAIASKLPQSLAKYISAIGGNALVGASGEALAPDRKESISQAAEKGALTGALTSAVIHPVTSGISGLLNLNRSVKNNKANPFAQHEPIIMQAKEQQESTKSLIEQLKNKLLDTSTKEQVYNGYIDQASDKLNALTNITDKSKNRATLIPDSIRDLKKSLDAKSKVNYKFLDNNNINLSELGGDDSFPTYQRASKDLLKVQKHLIDVFGTDHDLSNMVRSEAKKASQATGIVNDQRLDELADKYASRYGNNTSVKEKILSELKNSKQEAPSQKITLKDVSERIKNLGKLSSAARGLNDNYSASLLGKLKSALETDTKNLLNKGGHSDLVSQWENANKFHAENIVPFWRNPQIRKLIKDKDYKPEPSEISRTLHKLDSHSILGQLPDDVKNMSMFEMITQGRYGPSGQSTLSPKKLSSNLSSLKNPQRFAMASYNPEVSTYFENLPKALEQKELLSDQRKSLEKSLARELNRKDEFKKALDEQQKTKNSLSKEGPGIGPIRLPSIKKIITNPGSAGGSVVIELARLLGKEGSKLLNQARENPEGISKNVKNKINTKSNNNADRLSKLISGIILNNKENQ